MRSRARARACVRAGERVPHATGAGAGGLGIGGGRLHLKIAPVGGAPDLPKSDLVAGLPEADVDQVDLRTGEEGHG